MSEVQTRSANVGNNTVYTYFDTYGFEVRHGLIKDYNYTQDHKFELRVRHSDPEQIDALLDKIKEWLGITVGTECRDEI